MTAVPYALIADFVKSLGYDPDGVTQVHIYHDEVEVEYVDPSRPPEDTVFLATSHHITRK